MKFSGKFFLRDPHRVRAGFFEPSPRGARKKDFCLCIRGTGTVPAACLPAAWDAIAAEQRVRVTSA